MSLFMGLMVNALNKQEAIISFAATQTMTTLSIPEQQ